MNPSLTDQYSRRPRCVCGAGAPAGVWGGWVWSGDPQVWAGLGPPCHHHQRHLVQGESGFPIKTCSELFKLYPSVFYIGIDGLLLVEGHSILLLLRILQTYLPSSLWVELELNIIWNNFRIGSYWRTGPSLSVEMTLPGVMTSKLDKRTSSCLATLIMMITMRKLRLTWQHVWAGLSSLWGSLTGSRGQHSS